MGSHEQGRSCTGAVVRVSRDNVGRLAASKGYTVTADEAVLGFVCDTTAKPQRSLMSRQLLSLLPIHTREN